MNKNDKDLDIVDGMLKQMQFQKEHKYESHLSEFPDSVRKELTMWMKLWNLSVTIIPKQKKKSAFARWIKGVETLKTISGGEKRFERVLNMTYEFWKTKDPVFRPTVEAPDKIVNYFIQMESELTAIEEKEVIEELKRKSELTPEYATPEKFKELFKGSKNEK
jgi:hypothetical protein